MCGRYRTGDDRVHHHDDSPVRCRRPARRVRRPILSGVTLFRIVDPGDLAAPTIVAAFDSWVDAGSASSAAAVALVGAGRRVAAFDGDKLFDYRARRPTLEIVDGRLSSLTWPELTVRATRVAGQDVLVLSGAEPDYRWREFADSVVELCMRLGVASWISLGAIPAAVPHTRPVPILGTASGPDLLRGGVDAGPAGLLRVPGACISVLEMAVAAAGIPSVGYFAQVPHYVSGPYAPAAVALLRAVGAHLGAELPMADLEHEARQLRTRLDAAAALEETTRTYVERLESMVDEERLPSGDELIGEIERFLRERGNEGTQRNS